MSDLAKLTPVDPEISDEGLRKAEAYIEAEEGAANRLAGFAGNAVTRSRSSMSLFHLYAAIGGACAVPGPPDHRDPAAALHPRRLRAGAELPAVSGWRSAFATASSGWTSCCGVAVAFILIYACRAATTSPIAPPCRTRPTSILGVIFIVLVLEATRRTTGWIVPAISAVLFLLYAYFGPYLPAPWTHRGFDVAQLVGHLFITLEGIFGVPVDVPSS